MSSIGNVFLQSAIKRLKIHKELGEKTFEQLVDADFLYTPNETSNSLAVIIQHMSGNMISRWTDFLTTDGEKPGRERDAEFETVNATKQELIDSWNKGWTCCLDAIGSLTEADLLKTITIRNEPLSVIDAINRQLGHYPYHVGQIIYIGKLLRNKEWINLSMPKKKSEVNNG